MTTRTLILIAGAVVVLLLAAGGAWYFGLVGGSEEFADLKMAALTPLHPIKSDTCASVAPDGWQVSDSNENGTLVSMTSSDHSMIANFTVLAVKGAVAQGTATQPGTPPGLFVQQLVTLLSNAPVHVIASGRGYGAFHVMALESGRFGGYVLYHVFPLNEDKVGYGVLLRIALGDKNSRTSLATAGSVAAAIRCKAVAMPQSLGHDIDGNDSHGTGITAACHAGKCDDRDLAGNFNSELGTGWVHDSAGGNYNVDVAGGYSDSGPDGPGYYAMIDGSRTKLQPGLQ